MKHIKTLLFSSALVAGVIGFGRQVDAAEVQHTVATSDTLYGISMKYYGDADHISAIAKANNITDPNMIYDGETLKIDTDASAETTTETPTSATVAETTAEVTAAEPAESQPQGQTMTMESTAYSSDPADTLGGGTVTATGQNLLENPMAVAVDPSVIPLGTRLYVEGYGEAYAVDTGSAIQGNIIDVHFPTAAQANNWGRRQVQVTILS